MPTPLNAVAVAPDGEIVAAGADGKVYFLSPTRRHASAKSQASPTPIIALAISPDGTLVAAAGIRGSVAIIERRTRKLAHTLVGPGLAGLVGRILARQPHLADRRHRPHRSAAGMRSTGEPIGAVAVGTPEDPLAAYAGDPGAEVFRACVACHTLSPDEGNRAGPTLAGIFGRRIATLPGYNFSPALKKLDIVWTPETVAKLFEIGPAALTRRAPRCRSSDRLGRRIARRWWISRKATKNIVASRSPFFFALAQIIVRGARPRPRAARRTGSKLFFCHRGDAAIVAHLDDVEPLRRNS